MDDKELRMDGVVCAGVDAGRLARLVSPGWLASLRAAASSTSPPPLLLLSPSSPFPPAIDSGARRRHAGGVQPRPPPLLDGERAWL
jgi:hypothetical protein